MFPSDSYEGHSFKESRRGEVHHYFIDSIIRPGEFISGLMTTLQEASYRDSVVLHMNCPGGDFSTVNQLVNKVQESEATVEAKAEGQVYSGASMLFFASDVKCVKPLADFLVHDASGASQGKVSETGVESDHIKRMLKKSYYKCYTPYLTEEEVDRVLEGKDKWMHSEEVAGRLDRVDGFALDDNNNKGSKMKIFIDKNSPMSDKIRAFSKQNDLNTVLDVLLMEKFKKVADQCGVEETPTLVTNSGETVYGYEAIKSYLTGFLGYELQEV